MFAWPGCPARSAGLTSRNTTRTVSSPDRVSELLDRASVGSGLDWMGLEEQ